MKLYQIISPTFVAGAIARNGQITHCAPILRGKILFDSIENVEATCRRLGWELTLIGEYDIQTGKLEAK